MTLPAPLDLSEKVAIVTGASQGIGQGLAVCLARWGAQGVTLAARNHAGLQETAQQVEDAGSTACVAVTDITSGEQEQAMVDATLERFGRIDFFLIIAGIFLFMKIL